MKVKNYYKNLPHKTIERLSQYRRALLICLDNGKSHIFSHEIASIQHITPVQVRRDLMLIGYSGTLRKGYNIEDLIEVISGIIDDKEGIKAAVVGMGNLGKAIQKYLTGKRHKLEIVAGFDSNPEKIGKIHKGVECYSVDSLEDIIREKNIKLGILTVPADQAKDATDHMVNAGIKGILNYTPKPVNVPDGIYLEEYDMITTLEKVAFYIKVQEEEDAGIDTSENDTPSKAR
jgi:redox-sensing transcriptional repressor